MDIFSFLQYGFIQKAFIGGSFVALTCAILGVFLVLKNMSLIGDGLSHVSFGAIALGLFTGVAPFFIAIPFVALASILILKISEKTKIYGDASIGIVSAVGISMGVILASLSGGFNVDLMSFLFGNILAISNSELIFSIVISALVLISVYFLYFDMFSATFDEDFAKTSGIKTHLINYVLTVLTALTVVLSVKVVGVLLVSALLILPAVSALQIAVKFKNAIILAGAISVFSVIFGITFSFFADLPTGAVIVMVNALIFAVLAIYKRL